MFIYVTIYYVHTLWFLYADDVVIFSTFSKGLQHLFNKLHFYSNSWRLEVNLIKSKVMCLCKQKEATDGSLTFAEK